MRSMLIDASHKLAEASGAIDALGRPGYAREFMNESRAIRETLFAMEDGEALAAERARREEGGSMDGGGL